MLGSDAKEISIFVNNSRWQSQATLSRLVQTVCSETLTSTEKELREDQP